MSPERRRQRTIDVLTSWVTSIAARQPMVVVMEDIHWSILPRSSCSPISRCAAKTHRSSSSPPLALASTSSGRRPTSSRTIRSSRSPMGTCARIVTSLGGSSRAPRRGARPDRRRGRGHSAVRRRSRPGGARVRDAHTRGGPLGAQCTARTARDSLDVAGLVAGPARPPRTDEADRAARVRRGPGVLTRFAVRARRRGRATSSSTHSTVLVASDLVFTQQQGASLMRTYASSSTPARPGGGVRLAATPRSAIDPSAARRGAGPTGRGRRKGMPR